MLPDYAMHMIRIALALALSVSSLSLAAADGPNPAAALPKPNFSPGPEYADGVRMWQGIPGIERAANGRLWATWYGGGTGEDKHNYILVNTSADDGRTWSALKFVIDPDRDGPVRAFDPCLWHDPSGKLWLFWAQRSDSLPQCFAMTAEDSTKEDTKWSAPRRISDGIMMNKPTACANGDWLLPTAIWKREQSSRVERSTDRGATWNLIGAATIPKSEDWNCDENMIVQRKDNSLWMLVRTRYGIGETSSTDGGKSWGEVTPSAIPHVASRFFIRRLQSGKLLLVRHNPPDNKTRSHLAAFISSDEGKTWQGGLMIDERKGVSYPDAVEGPAGQIRLIYDFDRVREKYIYLAAFSEADVLSGNPSESTRLRVVINHATGVNPKTPAAKKPEPAKKP
jgi:predicted neuraminidase